jgi:uncharacterized lipoprotein YddW (UPF0748 family)
MNIRIITFTLFIVLSFNSTYSQNKAIWATIWSVNNSNKIDDIVLFAENNNFNQIFIQTRYRADALYFPNKNDSTFENSEPRSYILRGNDFDPLEYLIKKLKGTDIEVHAWIPVFVLTPHDLMKIDTNHLYFHHSEWITLSEDGKKMMYNEHEGAFLDPGIPAVQTYMLNIIGDIAKNYDIDGIQLDYIRYPDSIYGYNQLALEHFKQSGYVDFNKWKEDQINGFVNKAFIELKNIDPKLKLSAAVYANQSKAINKLSQNWKKWLTNYYVDNVYVMAYNTSNSSFENVINGIEDVNRNKTTIVLRAWKDKKPYNYSQINDKLNISKRYGFINFGFYSYSGLVRNNYIKHIKF